MIVKKIWGAFGVNSQVEFNQGIAIWCTERVIQTNLVQGNCYHKDIVDIKRPIND